MGNFIISKLSRKNGLLLGLLLQELSIQPVVLGDKCRIFINSGLVKNCSFP